MVDIMDSNTICGIFKCLNIDKWNIIEGGKIFSQY